MSIGVIQLIFHTKEIYRICSNLQNSFGLYSHQFELMENLRTTLNDLILKTLDKCRVKIYTNSMRPQMSPNSILEDTSELFVYCYHNSQEKECTLELRLIKNGNLPFNYKVYTPS